jgi:ribosomal protein L35
MLGKVNKMVLKRFKLTRKGKLMRKRAAVNHFNARKTSNEMSHKRKTFNFALVNAKAVKAYLR